MVEVGDPLTTMAAFTTTVGGSGGGVAVAEAAAKRRAIKPPIVVFVFIVLCFFCGVESGLLCDWTESPLTTLHEISKKSITVV